MLSAPASWDELPRTAGTIIREGYALEFKREVDPANRAELAKDVALLANMYGGTLLVGALETNVGVDYIGLSAALARAIQEAYTCAVRDFCSPRPMFTIAEIPRTDDPNIVVVAVLVEPFPDQPVGAAAPDPQGRPTQAWRFPIRVRSHATFARPDQLMLWLNPRTRRTAIALTQMRKGATIRFSCDSGAKSNLQPFEAHAVLTDWKVEENFIELKPTEKNVGPFRAPLEDVASAWLALDGVWQIRLRGAIVPGTSMLRYHAD